MIITENPTIGGKDFTKKYSDKNVYIRQDQTGILYDEAIDVENAPYTYTETDIPAVDEAKYEFERVYYETDIPVEAELIEPEEGVVNNDK